MNSALNGPEDTLLLSRLMSNSSSRQSSIEPVRAPAPAVYPSGTLDSLREFEAAELRLVEESEENVYTECEGREEEGEGDYAEPVDGVPAPVYSCVGEVGSIIGGQAEPQAAPWVTVLYGTLQYCTLHCAVL